jgi:plasmid stabilization system protein ParE
VEIDSIFGLEFEKDALQDIEIASKYYLEISPKLKNDFENDLQKVFQKIESNPQQYQLRYSEVRLAHLRRFPFSIHFVIDFPKQVVIVLAIFHQHQNPENWLRG